MRADNLIIIGLALVAVALSAVTLCFAGGQTLGPVTAGMLADLNNSFDGSFALAADIWVSNDIFIFGFAVMNQIVGNYALRMAGVYMLSISTLWTRTSVMPRWLTIISYIVALGFLFFAGTFREARFIFPAWVFLVSVYILIVNRRIVQ